MSNLRKFLDRSDSRYLFFVTLGVFLLFAFFFSVLVYDVFQNFGAKANSAGSIATPVFGVYDDGSDSGAELTTTPDTSPKPLKPDAEMPKWDGTKRVTMLIMGLDYRDWEAQEAYSRTDTMMLLTIDPVAKTAGMLSIPRDLWAAIPGFNPAKINTAHYFGDLYKYPGGGPALAVKTVENVIGVPIDYYARIDFNTFVDFIDLIGGIKVDVTETIELEVIGKQVDPILEPGRYTLDGRLALAYARNRHTGGGDFDRARRQQQVIMGIRDRLLNPKVWKPLLQNASTIYAEFSSGITTNLPLEDAIKLALLALQVQEEDIDMAVIGLNEAVFGTSPDNLSILVPLPDKIRELRDRIFATGGAFTPAMAGDAQALMQIEQASIVIRDGTTEPGLADRTAEYLRSLGANVVAVESAGTTYSATSLIYHTGTPYALSYLAELMEVGNYNIFHRLAMDSSMDIEIWLGSQWQNSNPMP